MEAIASPVSSLRGAIVPTSSHPEAHLLLKSPLRSSYHNLSSFKPKTPFTLCSSSSSNPFPLFSTSSHPPYPPPPFSTRSSRSHYRAATGYAAALIDAVARRGPASLASVAADVRCLAAAVTAILADGSIGDEQRSAAVLAAATDGGLDRRLLVLTRMVLTKGRGAGALAEVLEEFGRIWSEMTSATENEEVEVVVVAKRRIGVEKLADVAKAVGEISGAVRVKVKHLFRRRPPQFAV
ncbi:hypothetical protein HPP92_022428 [Vanilla planifolia]|uniref:Uncharacterized protein n=1 Tax=Vanilla planifolia TaxID=51239 RepID=A0A835UFA9_VANPL|nr:hypothetical protein HPP92_022428 [Vanilla planifolia]